MRNTYHNNINRPNCCYLLKVEMSKMENILQFFSIWKNLKWLFLYCEFCHIMEWKSGISSYVDLQLHSALDCFLFWLIANTGLQNLLFWESLFHLWPWLLFITWTRFQCLAALTIWSVTMLHAPPNKISWK